MADVNVRFLALESLIEIIEKKQYSHLIENQILDKYAYLDKRDRAFYTRIVEGTLGSMLTLDYIINQFSKTPVKKQKPLIRTLLRMSVYQIMYMDAVPDSAAINEAVKIAKKKGFQSLSGFVNGVLRNLSRGKNDIQYPKESDDFVNAISIQYSLPEWMVEHFVNDYGKDAAKKIAVSLNEEQMLSVRVNTAQISLKEFEQKMEAEAIRTMRIPETASGYYISGVDRLNSLESFLSGDFYVQDASSMLVAEWAQVKENDYCIDVCAAPGGKSTHIAQLLNGTGHVDSRDLTDYKVSLLADNIERLHLTNMSAKVWDATIPDESVFEKANVVICDAPCSGLGVMGKKKDIRYNITKESCEELSNLQRTILSTVCKYVVAGGTLIYSTCTINRAENEDNVEWFVKEHPEFVCEEMRQLLPHEIGNDGFFLARLKRKK